jgi:conjugation transfer TcpE-like protein
VAVRSYRAVLDDVERRIYRVDRWRLPAPGGVQVRAILYTIAAAVVVMAAAKLPVVGQLLALLPVGVRVVALPVLLGWALASWQIDGRAPHHALAGLARYCVRARTLAGLRPTAAVGAQLAPVAAVEIAPAGDEPAYRRGRVRGPARVVLRYPARLEVERRRGRGSDALAAARRVRVCGLGERPRPLSRGRELRVPEGAEVVFE